MITPLELLIAFGFDVLIGDPRWLPHPVRIIGKAIEWGEAILRKLMPARIGGVLLAVTMVGATYFLTYYAVEFIRLRIGGITATIIIAYLASTTLALRGLVMAVGGVFKSKDIELARRRLSRIVGRDTASLDEEGIHRAAIETLAENTSDGIIAPLFYLAIGGVPLAMAYKAVNTLDSMVGYKNDRYIKFGWAPARIDDIANFIPARLTGALMVVAASFVRAAHATDALMTMLRDGGKHSSPNSGIPEAAMAGALGVVLGGPSVYGGVLVEKPRIGEGGGLHYKETRCRAMAITTVTALGGLALAATALQLRLLL